MSSAEPDLETAPGFDGAFRERLVDLLRWRRDVRRFRRDPLDPGLVDRLVALACLAPSVGHSQPWRFVKVAAAERRAAIRENFLSCNQAALADYQGERAKLYARLKLAGLEEAPVHLAVFCDEGVATGQGLGRKTMPESLRYSVVTAVHTLWLAARAWGIGVGWVSILDPVAVRRSLEVPESWDLVAYLCIGYPQEEHLDPELERHRWESRLKPDGLVLER